MRAEAMRKRRRAVRRAVALDVAVQSDLWDEVVQLPASNLSTDGMWLDTPIALEPGEDLIVSFTAPGSSEKVWATARVVRSTRARRRDDAVQVPGMGLVFTYVSDDHRRVLARALLGQPPRLPRDRVPPPLPPSVRAANTIKICDPSATIQLSEADVREDMPLSANATIQVSDEEVERLDEAEADAEAIDPSRVVRLPTRADESIER